MEPVGILNACTTHVRTKSARITAMTIDSKYSRTTDFLNSAVVLMPLPATSALFLLLPHLQYCQKGLLRDFDAADALHALLAFLLFLEQFALARNIAAIALGEHVLAHRPYGCTRDDADADRQL